MEKLFSKAVGFIVAALALWEPAAHAQESVARQLRLVTTHFPPFAMEHGREAPGPLVKVTLAAITRAGHNGRVEFVPWPRAQLMATGDEAMLIIPLVRSSDREARYQWIGKLYCRSMGYVSIRAHMARFDSDVLATAHLAVLRAAPYRESVKTKSMKEATSFEDMAKLLKLGLVDVIYGNQETIALAMKAQGVERSSLAMSGPIETDMLWLAASLALPARTAEVLRQSLRALRKDGSMDRIFDQERLPRASCPGP